MAAGSVPAYLLCGYYGENNLGDDVIDSLLTEIPQPCRFLVTAHADATSLAPDAEVVNRRFAFGSAVHRTVDAGVRRRQPAPGQHQSSKPDLLPAIIAIARLRGCPVLSGVRADRFSVPSAVQWCACLLPAAVPAGGIRRPWIEPGAGLLSCRCSSLRIQSGDCKGSPGLEVNRSWCAGVRPPCWLFGSGLCF